MFLDQFPGFKKGIRRLRRIETSRRIAATMPFDDRINGVAVCRLTPRHFDQMELIQSPFLVLRRRRIELGVDRLNFQSVLAFLWIISPFNPLNQRLEIRREHQNKCRRLRTTQRARFVRYVARLPRFAAFEAGLDRYLQRELADRPGASGAGGRQIPSAFSVAIVNRIAAAYGWPDQVLDADGFPIPNAGIMDMPVARLYQYWRWIRADENNRAPVYAGLEDHFKDHYIGKLEKSARKSGFKTLAEYIEADERMRRAALKN